MPIDTSWSLALHGGAGIITRKRLSAEQERAARIDLRLALDAGAAILADGGSALDAVEATVHVLEDSPSFNAGRGAVLTLDGSVELDAAIMDGRDRRAGAITGICGTRRPVSLARAVMDQSPHVMLAGSGAERFGREHGLEQVSPDWFILPERHEQLAEMKARGDRFDADMKYGTVGAVAADRDGHVAAATSTGGIMGKRWGRVGDSPIPGAGTYADDRCCAVSATGSGEYFMRVAAAHEIGARMRMLGEDAAQAAQAVMAEVQELGGTGGVIYAVPGGDAGWSFVSQGMYRAKAGPGGRHVAIFGDE